MKDQETLIGSSSIKVEQEHMVVTEWHGRMEGNVGYIHMVQL